MPSGDYYQAEPYAGMHPSNTGRYHKFSLSEVIAERCTHDNSVRKTFSAHGLFHTLIINMCGLEHSWCRTTNSEHLFSIDTPYQE